MLFTGEQNIDEGVNNLFQIYSSLEERNSFVQQRSIQNVNSSKNISVNHRTSIEEKNKFRSFRKSYSVDQGFVEVKLTIEFILIFHFDFSLDFTRVSSAV